MGFIFALYGHFKLRETAIGVLLLVCATGSLVRAADNRALQFTNSAIYSGVVPLDTIPNLTIELWIRLDSSLQTGWPLSYGGDSTGFGMFLYGNLAPGFPSPIMIASGSQPPSITGNCALLPLGGWVHIALTRSDSLWKLYRDGMLVGRGILQAPSGDGILRIGQFFGALQQVRIWNVARSGTEIRSQLYQVLPRTTTGLYASFVIDSASIDSIVDNVHGFVLRRSGAASAIRNTSSGIAFQTGPSPRIDWASLPGHLQFIPRSQSNYGAVVFAGTILDSGCDSVIIEKVRDEQSVSRWSFPLHYHADSASFLFRDSIFAERSLYSYTVWCKKEGYLYYESESADLTSGDVYLIDGQSNAHAGIAWFFWQSPFLRSFGVQTPNENFDLYDPADTLWGLANGNDWGMSYTTFSGPYMVGVWGWELQNDISNKSGVPVCIINGAAGGSTIEQHERSDSDSEDLHTVYGRLLYRVQKSGCENSIKGIFWDQGEFNTSRNYYQNYEKLYNDWRHDYPAPLSRKTYLLQVRPGCGPPGGSALREVQRRLADSIPNTQIMSTVGVRGHNGCHYDAYGYVDIGNDLARLVERDYYGSVDTSEIDAPNVRDAHYSNTDSSTIDVIMRRPDSLQSIDDTPFVAHPEPLQNYFYLDGVAGAVERVLLKSDTVQLILNTRSKAKFLTYLPDQDYNDTATVYEGPWIVNRRGIGLLSFDSVPIEGFSEHAEVAPAEELSSIAVSICRRSDGSWLQFALPDRAKVSITLFDVLGRTFQRTLAGDIGPGICSCPIGQSESVPPGTYIVVVQSRIGRGSAVVVLP